MSEWSMSDLDFFISIIRKIIFELVFYNVNVKCLKRRFFASKLLKNELKPLASLKKSKLSTCK